MERKWVETAAGRMGVRYAEGLLLGSAEKAGSFLLPRSLPAGWVRVTDSQPVVKLTQNPTLHPAMVQQLGPRPLPHGPAQGLREHILTSVFASNTQGLAQPGERRRQRQRNPGHKHGPSVTWGVTYLQMNLTTGH